MTKRRELPRDMSFIDRSGQRITPNKPDYEAAQARKRDYQHKNAIEIDRQYSKLINQYGKNSKEVYAFERQYGMKKSRRIEGTLAIIGFVTALFFLSSNLTGNAIGISNTTSNYLGVGLIILSLVAGFFWMKNS